MLLFVKRKAKRITEKGSFSTPFLYS
jgi:hypothetical protein